MNVNQEPAGVARARIFYRIVCGEGTIKRGILTSRMAVSEQTFVREYRGYMEQYAEIKYNPKTREFIHQP